MPRSLFALFFLPLLACGGTTGGDPDGGQSLVDGREVTIDAGALVDAIPLQLGCSEDLHDVLNGDGSVLETCSLDEGCFSGECIPPVRPLPTVVATLVAISM